MKSIIEKSITDTNEKHTKIGEILVSHMFHKFV